MACLELLASPPGTGKTTYCVDLFKKEILKTKGGIESRSFFILPNREHAQRIQNLILKKDVVGLFNVHILTINDLTSKIMGASLRRSPSDTLRRRLVREILEDTKVKLPYFDRVKKFNGFHELLTDAVKEFNAGLLTVKSFEKYCQSLLKNAVFQSKFRDFSIVLKKYHARLEILGLQEMEDGYLTAFSKIRSLESPALVIFDGFYHFTRSQQSLIWAVSRWSKHTVATLTLSNHDNQRDALFEYPERTKIFLMGIGFRNKSNKFNINYRTKDPCLLHLEKNIFSNNVTPYVKSQNTIQLIQAPDVKVEIEMIAREIKRIHRETPVHWSDCCIILRELGAYEKLIQSVFQDFDIPVHIHERKKLIENGLVKVLYRFLNLASDGWKREDLLFTLKSSYGVNLCSPADALLLESLAFSQNISEGRERWSELISHPSLTKSARESLEGLLVFEASLMNSKNSAEFNGRFLSWISSLCFLEGSSGYYPLDAEAIEALTDILKTARRYETRSDSEVFLVLRYLQDIRDAMDGSLFSINPRGKNRVQVYDVVMALPKEYKVVILPGLLEKTFPKSITEDPIFKDAERRVINKKEIVLEERLSRIAGERYFFYMAITRARERLILSYPQQDIEGRPLLASFFLEEVEKCFKEKLPISAKLPTDFLPFPEEWSNKRELLKGLADHVGRSEFGQRPGMITDLAALPEGILEMMDPKTLKKVIEFGGSDDAVSLKDPVVKESFHKMQGPFSATKIETFAVCAFKYYASRILRLNEPLEGRQAIEMGNLLHKTLEEFYRELSSKEKETGLFLKSPLVMTKALHEKLELLLIKTPFAHEPLYRQRLHVESMKRCLSLFVDHERELFMKRGLVPTYFEWSFGRRDKGSKDYLKIEDKDGSILIEGQIDRVDIEKNKTKALIVDYKRSSREFSVHEKIRRGLEFQLPIYLLAVRKLLGLEVVGAELRILREAKSEGFYRESQAELLGLHSRTKVYSEDVFENILSHTESLIRENLKKLRSGDISVNSKSCKFCSFSSVCRFEPWRLVYQEEALS